MAEIKQNIVNLVREEGISLRKISDILGRDYDEILKIGKELKASGELTDKDFEEGRNRRKLKFLQENEQIQRILSYKRDGISDNKVSKMPDIAFTQSDVSKYVRECIEFGLISGEEIDMANKEREEREKESDPNRIRVLEGLKRGELDTEIAKDTTVTYAQVKNIRLELIQTGKITEQEINEARNTAAENRNREKAFIGIDKETVFSHLVLGYDIYDTRDKVGNVDPKIYANLVKELIKEGRITREEKEEYRRKREEEYKDKILDALKKGMSQRNIASMMGFTLERTQTFIKKIKSERNVTNEDISKWKAEQSDSLENKRKAVLEGIAQGFTNKEIIEAYPNQNLEESDVKNILLKLKEENAITNEEIRQYRREGREKKISERQNTLTPIEEKVLEYLKKGYLVDKIAECINKSKSWTFKLVENVKKKGYITDLQIKEARERAKQREIEEKNKQMLEEARKKREKDRRNLQIMQSRIRNDVNLDISLTEEKIDRIKEYINASYEFYDKEIMPVAELAFIEKAIRKMPISEEEFIRFSRTCMKSQDSFRAFCMLQKRNELDIKIESEENLKHLEQYLKNACKIERAIQMIKIGNTETEAIIDATKLSADRVNILKIRLSNRPLNFLNFETREKVIKAYMDHKGLSAFYERRGTTDFERTDIENQVAYRKISPTKRDEIQEIRQDSKIRIAVLCTKLGLERETTARVIKGSTSEEVEGYLKQALKGELIKEDELQGIKMLEDPFKEDKEKSK